MKSNFVMPRPRLADRRIGILAESDFVEEEISYYQHRFAEEGAEVVLLTRLWGNPSLTFTGHEQRAPLTVSGDLEELDYTELSRYSALLVPSGMVSDRLRFSEDVDTPAPAVELMRRAFRLPRLVKAFSCHALSLVSAAPELIAGRPVTCHNNLVGDVRNMGAVYTNQDVVADDDLVTGRTVAECHLLARAVIELLDRPTEQAEPSPRELEAA
ncbi:thiamine biosynthesis protein ThiJ [Streptomyces sp. SID1328]|uniref:DJ-1/PfpI family protein n=1 Tax=Streptomyces sp. SID1328 TaxID=2690250 RepID=UPI00136E5E24|nr:DJ-1/PfpI family protein [Streptomyces sp. SID1328]MYV39597.1 thiamine biosynthesis protein ThiJ [Streptomyces sp. SID1328]